MEQTQKTRKRILKAAIRAFGRTGYWSTSIDDIARSARVAKGTVYLHFPDKEALFLAVVEHILEQLSQRMLEDTGNQPLRQRIRKRIATYLSFFEEHAVCFHAVTQQHTGLTRRFAEIFWKMFMDRCGSIEEEIRRDIAAGDLRAVDPRTLLFLIVGMMHGAIHQWFLSGRSYRLTDKTDEVVEFIYRGIRSSP